MTAGRVLRAWLKADEMTKLIARSAYLSGADERRRQRRADRYPEENGAHIWNYRGTVCTLVRCDWYADELKKMRESDAAPLLAHSIKWMSSKVGNLQGYARFDKRPLHESGWDGIVTYIPAPGGITFAQRYTDGSFVYGYDTAHFEQEGLQFRDKNWHVVQVEYMVDAIMIARRLERAYRDAWKHEQRARVLVEFDRRLRLRGSQIDVKGNFGVMLRLLGGNL